MCHSLGHHNYTALLTYQAIQPVGSSPSRSAAESRPRHHKDFQRSSQKSARPIAKRIFCFLSFRSSSLGFVDIPHFWGYFWGVARQRKKHCLPRYPQHAKALFLADIPTITFLPCPAQISGYPQRRSNTPMPLSDTSVRNAKAQDKALKLFDGGGLFLFVSRWRQTMAAQVPFSGQRKTTRLGRVPRYFPERRP